MITKQANISPSLEDKIAFLKSKEAFPFHTENVDTIETHHSWIFLTDHLVYKLKKPIRNTVHNYATLEARLFNSQEELRLNRRLALEVYLDIVSLTVDEKGQFFLERERGQIVDWLVKMKRIPAENILDFSIKNNTVTAAEIDQAALRLAQFFKTAPSEKINFQTYKNILETEIKLSQTSLQNTQFGLDTRLVNELATSLLNFVEHDALLLKQRIEGGYIKEGHGDLRPEHICLRPKPLVFDCLEFNRSLRLKDPADELSFLSLECDLLNAPKIGERFIEIYRQVCDDPVSEKLLHFYKAYRAFLRARLAVEHLLEKQYQGDPKWQKKTRAYLKIGKAQSIC